MSDADALRTFLASQAAAYRASLPGRLASLLAAWDSLQADPSAPAHLQALERCAHGIAGSAAVFGLPALGDTARRLEEACESPAAQKAALQPLVDALAEALRHPAG